MSAEVARTRPRGRHPVVGSAVVMVGVVHLATSPFLYGDEIRSILRGGVVGSVDADPAVQDLRSLGFWFLTAGVSLLVLGALVIRLEREHGVAPAVVGWLLLGLGVWGVLLVPASPFWVFVLLAVLVWWRRR